MCQNENFYNDSIPVSPRRLEIKDFNEMARILYKLVGRTPKRFSDIMKKLHKKSDNTYTGSEWRMALWDAVAEGYLAFTSEWKVVRGHKKYESK